MAQELTRDGHTLSGVMAALARKRPVFHSEADFQHALAWEIRSTISESEIRLEHRPRGVRERMYLDLWVRAGGQSCAIELKYKTRGLTVESNGEVFDLLDQSAQDIGRYEILKDVARLERVVKADAADQAAMIFLTNDQNYWSTPPRPDTIDAAFRLHEGRVIQGALSWAPRASPKTTEHHEEPIMISAAYEARWDDYSTVAPRSPGSFRYLMMPVAPA